MLETLKDPTSVVTEGRRVREPTSSLGYVIAEWIGSARVAILGVKPERPAARRKPTVV